MPIYEYRCGKCGKGFERLVRSAAETVNCPACGAKKAERQLSVFAAAVKNAVPASCPVGASCPSAGSSCCGGGCGHRHAHG
jgi:putative FmdB family regulatory protein